MEDSYETCRVCGHPSDWVFSKPFLERTSAYFDCEMCSYQQTESPYSLGEVYAHAINEVDTDIMRRNRLNVGRMTMTRVAVGCDSIVCAKIVPMYDMN